MVCQATGAVHTELMHTYGTSAFLSQWNRFTALRGDLSLAVSDRGSQLTSGKNNIAFLKKEAPGNWNWDEVHAVGARCGTEWRFVPPGAQFQNGLAERRVAVLKDSLHHLLAKTIIGGKPTLNYAKLSVLLSRAANIVNDWLIGVKSLTEDEIILLMVIQLLLGHTSTATLSD